jgi:Tfp pilus assembly protein PilF
MLRVRTPDFTEMIGIKKSTNAYKRRAGAYSRKGDYAHALVDLREATKAAPDESAAFTNLAWFLATCADPFFHDGKEAVIDATKPCELSHWKNGYAIDTLAAASAEAGDFDRAMVRSHDLDRPLRCKRSRGLRTRDRLLD